MVPTLLHRRRAECVHKKNISNKIQQLWLYALQKVENVMDFTGLPRRKHVNDVRARLFVYLYTFQFYEMNVYEFITKVNTYLFLCLK